MTKASPILLNILFSWYVPLFACFLIVVQGSRQYPFKGYLDTLALKCLSTGTNAFTDQTYTAYTVTTAGSEGWMP